MILKKWQFCFKKIPNSHEFYFDIIAPDFEIIETRTLIEVETLPKKILDDDEIRFYFEERKRKEIENLLKMNMRIKTTPSKSSLMKESYSTASNLGGARGKITPIYKTQNKFNGPFSRLMTPGKFSATRSIRSIGKESPEALFVSNPFFSNSGIKRPGLKRGQAKGEYLSIEELMDVPEFIPTCFNVRVVRQIPAFLRKDEGGSRLHLLEPVEEEAENIIDPKEFSFRKKKKSNRKGVLEEIDITYNDVKNGLKSKTIGWNDLNFSKECLNYLERNIHVLD